MMKERNIRYTNVGLQRRGEKENPVRDIGDRCIIVSLCLCVCSMDGGREEEERDSWYCRYLSGRWR